MSLVLGSLLLPSPWDARSAAAAKPTQPEREVVELRSARSKTIRQPNGSLRTTLSQQSLHYLDADKKWAKIDASFETSDQQGTKWESGKNRFSVRLTEETKENFLTFDTAAGSVALSLEDASAAKGVKTKENAIVFKEAFKDVDVEYVLLPDGLKENIVLRKAGAPGEYRFRLTPGAADQFRFEERDDGSVWFFGADAAAPAFILLAPLVGDASGAGASFEPAEGKAELEVDSDGDSFVVTLAVDEGWLSSSERVYPVTLDPTLYVQPDVADGEYNTTAGGNPNVTASEIRTGRDGSGGAKYASVATFDVATIPPAAKVLDARLNAYLSGCFPTACGTGHTGDVELKSLASGWSQATPWATVIATPPTFQDKITFSTTPASTWHKWGSGTFTQTIQSMVNGSSANFGLLLEKTGGNDNVGYKWRSARWSDPSFSPFLEVYWVADGVQVNPSTNLHANGAELYWQHDAGGPSNYADSVFADSPVAYFRLDEAAGDTAVWDWSGKDVQASVQTATGVMRAEAGALVDLDPSTRFLGSPAGYVKVSDDPVIRVNDTFTLEAWIKRSDLTQRDMTIFNDFGSGYWLRLNFANKLELLANSNGAPIAASLTTIADTNWHHIAATKSGATVRLYIDGQNQTGTVTNATLTSSTSGLHVGLTDGGSQPFYGWIDEAALYPTALTETRLDDHIDHADEALDAFQRFEIHRSATANFTPSASTLIATVTDAAVQTFRDTTAKPSTTFYYEVVTVTNDGSSEHSFSSNELKAPLPAQGEGKVTIQPGFLTGSASATHISSATPTTPAGNSQGLVVGSAGTNKTRTLISFDMHVVPTKAEVSSAQLEMYALQSTSALSLHRVTASWTEGGATWNHRDNNVNLLWGTPGGDYDSSTSAVSAGGSDQHWDSWEIGSFLQQWVDGTQAHNGVIVKYGSENGSQPTLIYAADAYARSIALRPRLVITYEDGSQAAAPTVAVSQPQGSELVTGTVTVKAGALDDGAVSKVEFFLDGNSLGAADTAAPFELSWNTTSASRGSHTLTAKATDDVGNETTSQGVQVTVANSAAPTVPAPTTSAGAAYSSEALADTPVAYWRLGATPTTDSSGNGRTLTATGSPGSVSGLLTGDSDTARDFPGTGSAYYQAADDNAFDFTGNAPYTLEAWVNGAADTSYRRIVSHEVVSPATAGYAFYIQTTAGFGFHRYGSGSSKGVTYKPGAFTDTTHHLVGTYDGANLRLYLDGAQVGSTVADSSSMSAVTSTVRLAGASSGGSYYDGVVDEVAVYPTALSATRIQAHYQAGTSGGGSGSLTVSAAATDDVGVSKVDFYVDGDRFGSDTTNPYQATLDTLAFPVYDGSRTLTAKAYDDDGNVTTSAGTGLSVGNTAGTKYEATIATSNVPLEQTFDPGGGAQDGAPLTVSLTNTSTQNWPTASTKLRYRWFSADATPLVTDSANVSIGASDLGAGQQRNVSVTVDPPSLPTGVYRARYKLRLDLYDTGASSYFAAMGSAPYETWVTVTREVADELGLERYQQYDGEDLGGGFDHALNLANGNSLVQWVPFSQPGRGLNTIVTMTYNSLEAGSVSPLGNNWSLSVSSLTPFGLPLDVHPNAADTAAGRTQKWVGFTDADGSHHVFTGNAAGSYYTAPPGVHLYLQSTGSGYELSKPDRTKFVYNTLGFPTSVSDASGNALTYTLVTPPAGEDAYGLARRVTTVTDAGGRDFTLTYYSKAETPTPAMRGKLKRLTDHVGDALEFSYYEDGNLRSIREKGGIGDDGMPTPDRETFFTYTTPDGTGPAIGSFSNRQNPDPATVHSHKLFSQIDFRGAETQFAYSTAADAKKWRLTSRTNRAGNQTTFTYDTAAATTTATMPLSRVWTYTFDAKGRVTQIDDPVNAAHTQIEWASAPDVTNTVKKITSPLGAELEYAYNANGYKTDEWIDLTSTERAHTTFEYQNLPVDGNDVSGNWELGRSIGHWSQLSAVVKPVGNETASPTDYRWTFTYDTSGRVIEVEDPLASETLNSWNGNGTLGSQTLPVNNDGITRTTTFDAYDANGLATQVTLGAGTPDAAVARAGFAANGNLLFEQDPNHANPPLGTTPPQYQTQYQYDAFGRLVSSSRPKSTVSTPGLLIWEATSYDANDNEIAQRAASFGRGDGRNGALTQTTYDAMDRETLLTSPRTTDADPPEPISTKTEYDAAGRVTRVTKPKGVLSTGVADDYVTETAYDLLDRESVVTAHATEANATRVTRYCYDLAGDLRSVTGPRLTGAFPGCPAPGDPGYPYPNAQFTSKFEYDLAHRQTKVTDPLGHATETTYDANGQVVSEKDAALKETQTIYDDRGLRSKLVEPFMSGRTLTTQWEYDPLGNVKRLISPRAWDAAGGQTPPANGNFVETYSYDAHSRLVKTTLPTGPTGNPYFGAVAVDSPLAYWRLGDIDGNWAYDHVAPAANGQRYGTTLGQTGALSGDPDTATACGGAISCIVTSQGNGKLSPGTLSIELWLKTTSSSASSLVQSEDHGYVLRMLGSGAFWFKWTTDINRNGWTTQTTGGYNDGNWHHVVAVFEPWSGTIRIYVDGTQKSSFIGGAGSMYYSTDKVRIGGASGGEYFAGTLDEVAIYGSALSATQVANHYAARLPGDTTPAYRYQTYDANGQVLETTLPTTAASASATPADQKTVTAHWDTGAIYSSHDPGATKVRFDYTAEGWQAARLYELKDQPNTLDIVHAMYWDYLPDGLLRAQVDQEADRSIYEYDANGNKEKAREGAGVVAPGQSVLEVDLTYNSLDELEKVRTPKPGSTTNYLATLLTYDKHGNTATLTDNREENAGGSQVAAGRVFTYTYDEADRATEQLDDFASSTASEHRKITYAYTVRDELQTQTLWKNSSAWAKVQSSERTYRDNGLLLTLVNRNATDALIEEHTLGYIQGGVYLNGNRVSDVFKLKGPDPVAPCSSVACTQNWLYDARERLTLENSGAGAGTAYTLDPQGNATQQSSPGASVSRTFSGQQLQTQTQSGTTTRFIYDGRGNTDCSVKNAYSGQTCPAAGNTNLIDDSIYDYRNALTGYRYYNGAASASKTIDYTVDPLERPLKQVETISGATTTYDFTYVGITNALSKEVLTGSGATTKKYSYDVFGNRATITEGANRYSYLYDPHSSVSLLIDQNNAVKESYGYSAYGSANAALTKSASGFNAKTNPYRYTGKRLDSGSGTYDMGARRYSASTGRFLQYDLYYNALDNFGLSEDPLTQNRYALAGANPVNFVEVDGHKIAPVGACRINGRNVAPSKCHKNLGGPPSKRTKKGVQMAGACVAGGAALAEAFPPPLTSAAGIIGCLASATLAYHEIDVTVADAVPAAGGKRPPKQGPNGGAPRANPRDPHDPPPRPNSSPPSGKKPNTSPPGRDRPNARPPQGRPNPPNVKPPKRHTWQH